MTPLTTIMALAVIVWGAISSVVLFEYATDVGAAWAAALSVLVAGAVYMAQLVQFAVAATGKRWPVVEVLTFATPIVIWTIAFVLAINGV